MKTQLVYEGSKVNPSRTEREDIMPALVFPNSVKPIEPYSMSLYVTPGNTAGKER
jgi:hypothetical protein